jgi:hypothetical protein
MLFDDLSWINNCDIITFCLDGKCKIDVLQKIEWVILKSLISLYFILNTR